MQKKAKKPKDNEHIFPATRLTELALHWKELNRAERHEEAMVVLEDIVKGSTPMLERLALYEEFHRTVDLPVLVSAAQSKIVSWLMHWELKRGPLFSWFGTCAKNAFVSELQRMNAFRRKHHVTSDNLEKLHGIEDHGVNKRDLANEVKRRIRQISCPWGSKQEIGAVRYLLECVVDSENHDKQAAIQGACYAWGLSDDMSKFFYSWVICAMRKQMYDKIHVPFTKQDLLVAAESYTHIPGLLDILTWEQMMKLISVYGGTRMRLPTLAYLARLHADSLITKDIDDTELDPVSVGEVAKKHKRSAKSAQDVYFETIEKLNPDRYGEHPLYDE